MSRTGEDFLKKYGKFVDDLIQGRIDTEAAFTYRDVYGEFGAQLTHFVTPYLWILPVIAYAFLLIAFKRKRLYGPTQKCLICIIALDVTFLLFTGIRDGVLNILKMNYGFVEYRICWLLLISFRIQWALNAASIWIKSGMLIHQALLFLFPFQMLRWNLKHVFIPLSVVHLFVTVVYCVALYSVPIKGIPMIQEFVMGLPLKRIDACVIDQDHTYFSDSFHFVIHWFVIVVQLGYFNALPILIHCVCTVILAFCIRREMKKMKLLTSNTDNNLRNVKYLVMIRINIALGISFVIQEIPIFFSYIYLMTTTDNASFAQSTVTVFVTLALGIMKPVDVIIYASLSNAVKRELKRLVRCK